MLLITADTIAFLDHADALDLLVEYADQCVVSPTIGGALLGRSREGVRGAVDAGTLGALKVVHRRISLDALQAWYGRPITLEAWQHVARNINRRTPEDARHKLVSEDERHAA